MSILKHVSYEFFDKIHEEKSRRIPKIPEKSPQRLKNASYQKSQLMPAIRNSGTGKRKIMWKALFFRQMCVFEPIV